MKTERILLIPAVLITALTFVPATGAAELDMIFLTILAAIYFPGGFYFFSDRSIKQQKIFLSILSGLALFMIVMGVLFRVLYLPGSNEMLMMGVPFAFVLLVITIFALRKQIPAAPATLDVTPEVPKIENDLSRYYDLMVMRLAFWLIIGIGAYFVNEDAMIRYKNRNNPERSDALIKARRESKSSD